MCSPMPDLPEHCPIPIDAQGRGPADPDDTVAIVCWCGAPECPELEV